MSECARVANFGVPRAACYTLAVRACVFDTDTCVREVTVPARPPSRARLTLVRISFVVVVCRVHFAAGGVCVCACARVYVRV